VKVRLTGDALADLEEIGDWIAQDNPGRADSFIAELRKVCATLATRARRYPVAFSRPGGEVRKRTSGNYLIFYRIAHGEVQVLRILHGARDWAALLHAE